MVAAPQPQPISVEAYFALDDNAVDAKYEYYDGYVRLMAGGTPQHSLICMNVGTILTTLLRGTGSGCRAFTSDARVQLSADRYVYPDVTVSCLPEDIRDPTAIRAPIVVFEVLSPGTEMFDRNEKTNVYRACAPIAAYVLIDPRKLSVEVFERAGVFWHHFLYNTPDAIVELSPLGVKVPITEFYQDIELPPTKPWLSQQP